MMTEAAKEARRKYYRAYYATNREKQREYNRRYREAHPEKVAESQRKYREAHSAQGIERIRTRKELAFAAQYLLDYDSPAMLQSHMVDIEKHERLMGSLPMYETPAEVTEFIRQRLSVANNY